MILLGDVIVKQGVKLLPSTATPHTGAPQPKLGRSESWHAASLQSLTSATEKALASGIRSQVSVTHLGDSE